MTHRRRVLNWVDENQEASDVLQKTLEEWVFENQNITESIRKIVQDYLDNPDSLDENLDTDIIGEIIVALENLLYHLDDEKLDNFDSVVTTLANIFESDYFNNIKESKRSGIFHMASGAIRKHFLTNESRAEQLKNALIEGDSETENNFLRYAKAYSNVSKDAIIEGVNQEGENFELVNSAIFTISCMLNHITNLNISISERIAKYIYEGDSSEKLQNYVDNALEEVKDENNNPDHRAYIASTLTNLANYAEIGNSSLDISIGSENFNNITNAVDTFLKDTNVMLGMRDLTWVNAIADALANLAKVVLIEDSNYKEQFGEMLHNMLNFYIDEDVNSESYQVSKKHMENVANNLLSELKEEGYEDISEDLRNIIFP